VRAGDAVRSGLRLGRQARAPPLVDGLQERHLRQDLGQALRMEVHHRHALAPGQRQGCACGRSRASHDGLDHRQADDGQHRPLRSRQQASRAWAIPAARSCRGSPAAEDARGRLPRSGRGRCGSPRRVRVRLAVRRLAVQVGLYERTAGADLGGGAQGLDDRVGHLHGQVDALGLERVDQDRQPGQPIHRPQNGSSIVRGRSTHCRWRRSRMVRRTPTRTPIVVHDREEEEAVGGRAGSRS
jgi:hypothetical protein